MVGVSCGAVEGCGEGGRLAYLPAFTAPAYHIFFRAKLGGNMQTGFSSTGIYRVSLLFGLLAMAELVFVLLPSARPLIQLLDLVQFYLERIHPALGTLVGHSMAGRLALGTFFAWLASWLALEAFSKATDEISIWGNIREDSCGRAPSGARRSLCTACKWALTVALAPGWILLALVRRVRYGTRSVSSGFLTFEPGIVMNYIRHLLLGLAAVVAFVVFAIGLPT